MADQYKPTGPAADAKGMAAVLGAFDSRDSAALRLLLSKPMQDYYEQDGRSVQDVFAQYGHGRLGMHCEPDGGSFRVALLGWPEIAPVGSYAAMTAHVPPKPIERIVWTVHDGIIYGAEEAKGALNEVLDGLAAAHEAALRKHVDEITEGADPEALQKIASDSDDSYCIYFRPAKRSSVFASVEILPGHSGEGLGDVILAMPPSPSISTHGSLLTLSSDVTILGLDAAGGNLLGEAKWAKAVRVPASKAHLVRFEMDNVLADTMVASRDSSPLLAKQGWVVAPRGQLSPAEAHVFTVDAEEDFEALRDELQKRGMTRQQHEGELQYASRVVSELTKHIKYDLAAAVALNTGKPSSNRFSTKVSQCGGYSATFVQTMRLAGIPARSTFGFHGTNCGACHCITEVWFDSVGCWVPVEPQNGDKGLNFTAGMTIRSSQGPPAAVELEDAQALNVGQNSSGLVRFFLQADKDGSGSVSRDELPMLIQGITGGKLRALADRSLEDLLMRVLDSDKDGEISLDEYLGVLAPDESTTEVSKEQAMALRLLSNQSQTFGLGQSPVAVYSVTNVGQSQRESLQVLWSQASGLEQTFIDLGAPEAGRAFSRATWEAKTHPSAWLSTGDAGRTKAFSFLEGPGVRTDGGGAAAASGGGGVHGVEDISSRVVALQQWPEGTADALNVWDDGQEAQSSGTPHAAHSGELTSRPGPNHLPRHLEAYRRRVVGPYASAALVGMANLLCSLDTDDFGSAPEWLSDGMINFFKGEAGIKTWLQQTFGSLRDRLVYVFREEDGSLKALVDGVLPGDTHRTMPNSMLALYDGIIYGGMGIDSKIAREVLSGKLRDAWIAEAAARNSGAGAARGGGGASGSGAGGGRPVAVVVSSTGASSSAASKQPSGAQPRTSNPMFAQGQPAAAAESSASDGVQDGCCVVS